MIYTGLVSVTFRMLKPVEIVRLAKKAGLQGIEWGGDIHVPHGDTGCAREVWRLTCDEGLHVASYGSYYKVGCSKAEGIYFEQILETALELHAPNIRVWAGDRGSDAADDNWWKQVIEESFEIAEICEKAGITLSFEYHGGTLTDSLASAKRLMSGIYHPNAFTYWQPNGHNDANLHLETLDGISPWLSNVHVFHWRDGERLVLEDGKEDWEKFLGVDALSKGSHYCLMEFVRGDAAQQFIKDAQIFKSLVDSSGQMKR